MQKHSQLGLWITTVLLLMVFLNYRHHHKSLEIQRPSITNPSPLYIDNSTIQNQIDKLYNNTSYNRSKFISDCEKELRQHPMLSDAQVYCNTQGDLYSVVTQKIPIARVVDKLDYYICENGSRMPLSQITTARVPMVYNIAYTEIPKLFPLLERIHSEPFLKQQIVSILQHGSNTYHLQLRDYSFIVILGSLDKMSSKLANFKAFYTKLVEDKIENRYQYINLNYSNQVVCTLK